MAGAAAMQTIQDSMSEDAHLEGLLSAARALFAGAPAEMQAPVRDWLRLTLSRIAQANVDDLVRVRWLKSPLGRELVELAGQLDSPVEATAGAPAGTPVSGTEPAGFAALDDVDRRIAKLLTEGQTNREMAEALGMSETELARGLARVLAQLGASSRAEATSLAFRGLIPSAGLVAATSGGAS
jgi:DNA-binding NarL/FixJ family response regulator